MNNRFGRLGRYPCLRANEKTDHAYFAWSVAVPAELGLAARAFVEGSVVRGGAAPVIALVGRWAAAVIALIRRWTAAVVALIGGGGAAIVVALVAGAARGAAALALTGV